MQVAKMEKCEMVLFFTVEYSVDYPTGVISCRVIKEQ